MIASTCVLIEKKNGNKCHDIIHFSISKYLLILGHIFSVNVWSIYFTSRCKICALLFVIQQNSQFSNKKLISQLMIRCTFRSVVILIWYKSTYAPLGMTSMNCRWHGLDSNNVLYIISTSTSVITFLQTKVTKNTWNITF